MVLVRVLVVLLRSVEHAHVGVLTTAMPNCSSNTRATLKCAEALIVRSAVAPALVLALI